VALASEVCQCLPQFGPSPGVRRGGLVQQCPPLFVLH